MALAANLRDALVCAAAALSWASAQSCPVLVGGQW